MTTFWLGHGDSIAVLKGWPDNSIDSIVCDPPYGLEFMGKGWDSPAELLAKLRTFDQNEVIGGVGADRNFKAGATGQAHSHGLENHDAIAFLLWCQAWSRECLRVLKPGGHMLAFGGTRTYHQLAMGVELAGFEIRDSIDWIYLSGFPKSRNISKDIDRRMGAKPVQVRVEGTKAANLKDGGYETRIPNVITRPGSPEGQKMEGWGTALKPAHEPIVVARKPLVGRLVDNVLQHGTGGLNIDACRIPTRTPVKAIASDPNNRDGAVHRILHNETDTAKMQAAQAESVARTNALGRWPTNVVLGHGESCDYVPNGKNNVYGEGMGGGQWNQHADGRWPPNVALAHSEACTLRMDVFDEHGNEVWECEPLCPASTLGDAARIFYCPKPRKAERDFGCEGLPPKTTRETVNRDADSAGAKNPRAGAGRGAGAPIYGCAVCRLNLTGGRAVTPCPATPNAQHVPQIVGYNEGVRNNHPTIKPVNLMRYLVRLVTPPGGTVLDPFVGSGSTGIAALIEGFNFAGIDQSEEYLTIAHARLTAAVQRGRAFFGDNIFAAGGDDDGSEDDDSADARAG